MPSNPMKPQPFNLHISGCLCCPGLSILTEAFVMLRRLFLLLHMLFLAYDLT